jgi:hypothetical protein
MQLDDMASRYLPETVKTQIRKARMLQLAPRLLTSSSRVLPDFLLLGAQKSGTTSLFQYLMQHRQLASDFKKEIHFFDWNYAKGPSWYRAFFPTHRQVAKRTRALGRYLCGEATPYYLFHPAVPKRVHGLLPEAKFIVVLRNPVDRAYSHYQHSVARDHEMSSFEEAIEREPERLQGEEEKLFLDESYISDPHIKRSYFSRGCYADQLQRWLEYYPKEALFVAGTEELGEDPQRVCDAIYGFLELPPQAVRTSRRHNANKYLPMSKSFRVDLAKRYREHNERLYELLGRDLGWDR